MARVSMRSLAGFMIARVRCGRSSARSAWAGIMFGRWWGGGGDDGAGGEFDVGGCEGVVGA